MIVVIDYNVGNVKSVRNGLDYLGIADTLSGDPAVIESAAGVILPGVAAFGFTMQQLGPLAEVIKDVARQGKPLLGICAGYQILFERSSEMGEHEGLGLIQGHVQHFKPGLTVPHMGWNQVQPDEGMDLFAGIGNDYFYFAHSYHAVVEDPQAKVAWIDYGGRVPASVQKGNIFGVQFHPEKSAPAGLDVLRNFDRICHGGK